jgi:hypothetical protein
MTNEQTIILLRSVRTQVHAAVERAADTLLEQMPDIERHTMTYIRHRYTGKDDHRPWQLFGSACVHEDCKYEETIADGPIIALDPLYAVLDALDADIATLEAPAAIQRETAS